MDQDGVRLTITVAHTKETAMFDDYYREAWKEVNKIKDVTLERAINFYSTTPTGQYDEEAVACLRAVFAQRLKDKEAGRR